MLAWNILHGGGSTRMPGIALELLRASAHTIILIEFRPAIGGQIGGVLADHGWKHQLSTNPPPGKNGMFVASRSPITRERSPRFGRALPDHRWLGFAIHELGISVAAIHAPDNSKPLERKHFWRSLTRFARLVRGHPMLMMGDFNAIRHQLDRDESASGTARSVSRLASLGYVDAWRSGHARERDFTWFSARGNGYRLDHAWASPALAGRLRGAHHRHLGRHESLSDHAAIVVELAPPDPQAMLFDPSSGGAVHP